MSDHLFSLISIGSLAGWLGCALVAARLLALLRAGLGASSPDAPGGMQAVTSLTRLHTITLAALPLVCFLFIPPGSLPPFVDIYWGGPVCLALLWLGVCLQYVCFRDKSFYLRLLACATLLSASWLVLGWKAAAIGLPGGPFNLGSYAAEPVWRWFMPGYGLAATGIEAGESSFAMPVFMLGCSGLALMLAGILKAMSLSGNTVHPVIGQEARKGCYLPVAINELVMLAITAVLFIPLGFARGLGASPLLVFIFDYFGFWTVVFLLFFVVRIFGTARRPVRAATVAALLWLVGAAMFIFA
ncbi:hypothetical protein LJC48_04435 [Desulfovibrio sp. OttesenSCG-928-C06]|nr:hypothetical protein [Desulfovibrio sp. OttesenSCG-928-C06]